MVEEIKPNIEKTKLKDKLTTILFYISIVVIMVGFNFQDKQTGWFVQYTPTGGRVIQDIKFLDTLNGYAITDPGTNGDTSYFLKTTNGGMNWVINNRIPANFCCLSLKESNVFYISGSNSSGALVLKSTNNGDNWFNTNFSSSNPTLERCFFVNKDTGWVCANIPTFGGIWRTTDGGVSWQMQAGGQITAVFFIDKNTGWYSQGNASGTLFKTTNTGNNWVMQNNSFQSQINDLIFINLDTGWIAGGGLGTGIAKTTNSGNNWFSQPNPSASSNGRFFFNNKRGWLGSSFSKILVCLDGEIWGKQTMPTFSNFYIQFFDTTIGWTGYTYILHTTDGGGPISGIANNNEQIAKDFVLYQNFPNPFNQFTIINVQLPIAKNIKLNIYDITGKLVNTIINQKQRSGLHSFKFDGGNLSSGIYYYTLFVDGVRIDTKKLVLLK